MNIHEDKIYRKLDRYITHAYSFLADNKAHSHSTLEIILGVILAVLILILITLVYSCLKRYKKGYVYTFLPTDRFV